MTGSNCLPLERHEALADFEAAMDELGRRAARGELTLLEARQEIFSLRRKFRSPLAVATPAAQAAAAADAPGLPHTAGTRR